MLLCDINCLGYVEGIWYVGFMGELVVGGLPKEDSCESVLLPLGLEEELQEEGKLVDDHFMDGHLAP